MLAMTVDVVLGRNERDGGTRSRRGTRCLTLERRELMGPKCPRTRERGRSQRSRMVACGHLLDSRRICTASRVVKPRKRVTLAHLAQPDWRVSWRHAHKSAKFPSRLSLIIFHRGWSAVVNSRYSIQGRKEGGRGMYYGTYPGCLSQLHIYLG